MFSFFHREKISSLPLVLTQRRIYVLPTKTALAFTLVVFAMLIGAINYGLGLGHALVFLLIGMAFVGMVHTFRNLIALEINAHEAAPVFAGDIAHFPVSVKNPRKQMRRMITFSLDKNEKVFVNVPPEEEVSFNLPFTTTKRGRIYPEKMTISSVYPLGLFRAWWNFLKLQIYCVVYPKPIYLPFPDLSSSAQGEGEVSTSSGHDDFYSLREWRPSDSLRRVAWKAVAHRADNKLLVKEFAGASRRELWLDIDLTPTHFDLENKLSVLTGWVLNAEQENLLYGLRLGQMEIPPSNGMEHEKRCLRILAFYGQDD